MITARSALLERRTRAAILGDPARARLVHRLSWAGMSDREIGDALNCSQNIVRGYLFAANSWVRRLSTAAVMKKKVMPDPTPIPRSASVLLRYRPPQTERGIAGERERVAQHLANEISSWIGSFPMRDAQRQKVIEHAGLLLDACPLKADGEPLFDKNRTYSDLLGIWKAKNISLEDRSLGYSHSRWLASWIQFWITQPTVWDRALDLAFAHLDTHAEAA